MQLPRTLFPTLVAATLTPLVSSAAILANFNFSGGAAASSDSSAYSTVSAYDARSVAVGGDDSAISSFTGTAFMRAENTPTTISPATNSFYHTFSVTVNGLGAGETLDLTSLDLDYTATNISGNFLLGVYSDAIGYTGVGDQLATTNISADAGQAFSIDLTATNTVAGSSFTGLGNGEIVEFRFYFADNSTLNAAIHRLDNIVVNGEVNGGPPSTPNLLINPGFESTPFDDGWNNTGTVSTAGLNGSATAARLAYNSNATLGQTFTATANFTVDASIQVAGINTPDSFHLFLDTDTGNAIEIRGTTGNVLQVNNGGKFGDLKALSDGGNFPVPANTPIRIRVIGRDFGTATASYDVAWSEPGANTLTHAAHGLTAFVSETNATTGTGLTGIRFDRTGLSGHSYVVDDVSLLASAETPPAADYTYTPPLPDKVVNISGVYPHLTMTNEEPSEVGIGAIVPWADRLWAVTYTGHAPNGSTDKLYEITPSLELITRGESVGGTPANRFIHTASQQLNIGPYFIDSNRNVRVLPYSQAPGRHTGTAAHLTDPDNRLYIMTMENGVYDINVHDLSFITRYPDVQPRSDRFLHGYHGKGLYSGQGKLVAANNGRLANTGDPTGESGVLATWDGTTVADNGGSYFATNDPNTGIGDNAGAPVAAQPDYIAGWEQHFKVQHCEVTGPGGIYGNPNPATDPIWATGFDDKSVVVRVMEVGTTWNTWRLPKGSYTHDGSHGWHTEWPRIRQLDPGNPASPYLMHMHGIFYDFPKTFSAADFSGLSPICSYYKMPTDYCIFEGKLVMGKDDASFFENPLTLRTQSNLWFGQLEDLSDWGSPHGHGAVWKNEAVNSGDVSDAFLIKGFSQGTLHLRNNSGAAIPVQIQTSNGDATWTTQRTVSVPANGYLPENINDLTQEWVRLEANATSSDLTAFFTLSNPYPHVTPASLATDEFATLADILDDKSYSDGLLRVMAGQELEMEMASAGVDGSGTGSNTGYHIIGGQLELEARNLPAAEVDLRADAATSKEFSSDPASVWVTEGGKKLRLPRLDPAYDAPFASGWPRGFREIVTERSLLNCHGTFYEIPRDNSGGRYRMRPITTHGKRITDFASWRGLLALTGVLDDAPASDRLVRNAEGGAIWLGEADDLWQMGEPRGYGGPWLDTAVAANAASDPYLMYGYDEKVLELSHDSGSSVTFTVEVDFLADDTWAIYETFTVAPGETLTHTFPAGFRAHWVRVKSDTATTASAQFTYGPADKRDTFLDWGRDEGLPTASGRAAMATSNSDGDELSNIAEFVFGTDPHSRNPWPIVTHAEGVNVVIRDFTPEDMIAVAFETSTNLTTWGTRPDLVIPDPDQSGVPAGFTRMKFQFDPQNEDKRFVRLVITI